MPQPIMLKKLKLNGSMKTHDLLEITPPKDVLFIIGDWNAKVGRQETPGVTGKSLLSRLKKIYMYYLPELALFSLFNIND